MRYHKYLRNFHSSRLQIDAIHLQYLHPILHTCHNDYLGLYMYHFVFTDVKHPSFAILNNPGVDMIIFKCLDFLVALQLTVSPFCATRIYLMNIFDKWLQNKGLGNIIQLRSNLMIYFFDFSEIYTHNKPIKTIKPKK